MKKRLIYVLCTVLVILSVFSSCGKDENIGEDASANVTKISNEEYFLMLPESDLPLSPIDESEIPFKVSADDWNLILVNPWNYMPEDYEVELTKLKNGHAVDSRAYPELQEMMDAMRAEGLSPLICSSYRTNTKQTTLYNNKINEYLSMGYERDDAVVAAGMLVAIPGTSEHQLGLAVDIVDTTYQYLNENQEYTDVQKWLIDNSWKFGWILRYPNDKSDLTGISYEPWHYRYVGKEAAEYIYENEICLEEFLDLIK